MMDQYKKETAQIHAPAALIEMTKAAVREEENRIRKGRCGQIPVPAVQMVTTDYAAYHRKRSLRRWAYPVTAAAAVIIFVSVSMALRGVRSGDTMSGAADAGMDMMAASESAAEEETWAAMPSEKYSGAENSAAADVEKTESAEGAAAESMETSEETESNKGAAAESVEASEETGGADKAVAEAPSTESAEDGARKSEKAEDWKEDSMADTDAEKRVKEFRSKEYGSVKIDAVEEKPDFYDDPNVEDIVYENLTFRVLKEKKGWAAYVEVTTGEAYVIHGQIEDREAFLREAYARLTEEIG